MDPKFQTSFIPKRPVVPGGVAVRKKTSLNFLSLIGILVFIVALVLAGGSYFYEKQLIAANEQKKIDIQKQIQAFDPALTQELSVLKARIDSAKTLLNNHIALTAFFDLLQENTVSTIQFSDFKFFNEPDRPFAVEMNGRARSFNDVVFQSDRMLANEFIKNAVFSEFQLDDVGNVTFAFQAEIDPDLISYEKSLQELSTSIPESEETEDLLLEDVPLPTP